MCITLHMKRLALIISICVGLSVISLLIVVGAFGGGHTVTATAPVLQSPLSTRTTPNLTEAAATTIAQALIDKNPTGPAMNGTAPQATLNSASIVTQVVEETAQQAQEISLVPTITGDMLQVINATDARSIQAYLQSVLSIYAKHLLGSSINQANPASSDFTILSQTRIDAFKEILALAVPLPMRDIQTRLLTILGTQSNIFAALAQRAGDPLRALIAAKAAPEVATDALALQQDINAYIAAHHITL